MSPLLVYLTLVFQAIAGYRLTDTRIIGGEIVRINQYPHQASLQFNNTHLCGAAIVASQYALSAARCTSQYINIVGKQVRVGATIYNSGGVLRKVESVASHPDYKVSKMDMDIGVIKLTEALQFNRYVQPVSIVPVNWTLPEGDMLNVSGWGVTEFSPTKYSLELRAIRLPVVSRDSCSKAYQFYELNITENMLCAGGSSRTIYQGDIGGPATNSQNQLVGIVSWSLKRELSKVGYPSVFTNVATPRVHNFITYSIHSEL